MIRFKVFIPTVLILAVVTWFLIYRLDIFVKGALENAISSVTGTKTDITRLRISFAQSKLTIKKLEIGSQADPMKNALEFGDIVVDFQFLPILQKRFVVDDFSITGIAWGTPRKTSAYLPPKPVSKEPSWLGEITDQAFENLNKEFKNLPVAQLTNFEMPDDPKAVLDKLDLASMKTFKVAAEQAEESRQAWTQRYKEIKDVSEYKRLIQDARSLVQNIPQDPQEILKRAQTIQGIVNQLQTEKEKAEKLVGSVREDWGKLEGTYNSAKASLESDWNKAKGLVGFDAFDTKTLTKMIFGQHWVNQAERFIRIQQSIRGKLAQMKAKSDEDEIKVQPRAKGRDIIFVKYRKEPSFVWAKSDFSVSALEAGDKGRVNQKYEMKVRDVNSAPVLYGKPTTLDVKAEFKDMIVGSAQISALWDYTKDVAKDIYHANVKHIRAEDWPVGIPKVFPVKITKGTADANVDFEFVGAKMVWTNKVDFSGVQWNFDEVPKAGVMVPILSKVFASVTQFAMTLKVTYADDQLDFDIQSDLDNRLKEGVAQVLDEKLKEFQAKLRRELDQRVKAVRDNATERVNAFRGDIMTKVETASAEIAQYAAEASGFVGQLEKKAKDVAEQKARDAAKDLIKPNLPTGLPKSLPKLPF